jgi:hypothetical protein
VEGQGAKIIQAEYRLMSAGQEKVVCCGFGASSGTFSLLVMRGLLEAVEWGNNPCKTELTLEPSKGDSHDIRFGGT